MVIILKKILFILLCLNLLFSLNSFSAISEVNKSDLKVKNTIYYLNDELYTGKAIAKKDRFYFKEGKANGKWITFYSNGNIKSIINWEEGKLSGKYILYESNGQKSSEAVYYQGKENGAYKTYHKNGQIRMSGQYEMGKPVGTWEYFDKNGKMTGRTVVE